MPGSPTAVPIPISVSLSGIASSAEDPREALAWTAGLGHLGVRWIQLDGTAAGWRARELDRSARQDIAATLGRMELGLSGIDLFIPPRHFSEPGNIDRAVAAIGSGIELAADLRTLAGPAGPLLAVELPPDLPADVLAQIESAGARHGVRLADHSRPPRTVNEGGIVGIGFDPAMVLAAGGDVFDLMTGMRAAPLQARLCDWGTGGRIPAGARNGRLDVVEYIAALGVLQYPGPVVADLRGLPNPRGAANGIIESWNRAGSGTRGR